MKLARIGTTGTERPVVIDDDGIVHSIETLTDDIDGAFLADDGIGRGDRHCPREPSRRSTWATSATPAPSHGQAC